MKASGGLSWESPDGAPHAGSTGPIESWPAPSASSVARTEVRGGGGSVGQQPNELTPGAGPWHRWGYELRQFREARRLSQRALARKALIDRSHLGRFERRASRAAACRRRP
ncbi:helix-turn-helix domain-containing protein [Streptomyces anulatus]|uniref:helix-turn-helix domain-containing protein n=1 Tax=Streptomyces anulatus TaxID=1892 RepID=UPI00398CF602